MSKWSKTTPKLGEHDIFGDEDLAAMRADLKQLATSVADLADQLHAQFTTIAAHAEIAREQSEFARDEARADLERTRESLIDLIEQARESRPSYPPPRIDDKIDQKIGESSTIQAHAVEQRIDGLAAQVDDLTRRQRELTDMMVAILDNIVAGDSTTPTFTPA